MHAWRALLVLGALTLAECAGGKVAAGDAKADDAKDEASVKMKPNTIMPSQLDEIRHAELVKKVRRRRPSRLAPSACSRRNARALGSVGV